LSQQETWIDENKKKEVMFAENLIERRKQSEVTHFTDETREKLSDLCEDDLIIVTSEYQKGKGFEVQEIIRYDDLFEEGENS